MHYKTLLGIIYCIGIISTLHSTVYHVTPRKDAIEYRHAFVEEYITKEKTSYGKNADSFVEWEDTEYIKKHKHYPAGLYYANSNEQYNVSIGRNIVYSISWTGSHEMSLSVWRKHPVVDEETITQDAEECYDTKLIRTAIGAIVGVLISTYLGVRNSSEAAGAVALTLGGAAIGRLCSPSDKDRLIEEEYLPQESLDKLIIQMDNVGDTRADELRKGEQTYILESIMFSSSVPCHINNFEITPATKKNIQLVKNGNYAIHGTVAYSLPNDVEEYSKDAIKDRLTIFASIKRLLGLSKIGNNSSNSQS